MLHENPDQATLDQTQNVQEYYGKTLTKSEDLQTNACCTGGSFPDHVKSALSNIHEEVSSKYYGCGMILPEAIEGRNILDLGSGSGRDSYLLAQLVGEKGSITGVDMTEEQLAVASAHLDYHRDKFGFEKSNVTFLQGNIEELQAAGIKQGEFDIAVSNCVINLVNDKKKVLQEVYNALKEGGELHFSDVYADRRVPAELAKDPVLYGECLSGALYWNDFLKIAKEVGFIDPRWSNISPITVENAEIQEKLGPINFYSVTCRLFKLPQLEPNCEDYGHAVRYKGNLENAPHEFVLDSGHNFAAGKIEPVCGNSYHMLKSTRFESYFDFYGDFSKHHGVYAGCGESMPFNQSSSGACEDSDSCGC